MGWPYYGSRQPEGGWMSVHPSTHSRTGGTHHGWLHLAVHRAVRIVRHAASCVKDAGEAEVTPGRRYKGAVGLDQGQTPDLPNTAYWPPNCHILLTALQDISCKV